MPSVGSHTPMRRSRLNQNSLLQRAQPSEMNEIQHHMVHSGQPALFETILYPVIIISTVFQQPTVPLTVGLMRNGKLVVKSGSNIYRQTVAFITFFTSFRCVYAPSHPLAVVSKVSLQI